MQNIVPNHTLKWNVKPIEDLGGNLNPIQLIKILKEIHIVSLDQVLGPVKIQLSNLLLLSRTILSFEVTLTNKKEGETYTSIQELDCLVKFFQHQSKQALVNAATNSTKFLSEIILTFFQVHNLSNPTQQITDTLHAIDQIPDTVNDYEDNERPYKDIIVFLTSEYQSFNQFRDTWLEFPFSLLDQREEEDLSDFSDYESQADSFFSIIEEPLPIQYPLVPRNYYLVPPHRTPHLQGQPHFIQLTKKFGQHIFTPSQTIQQPKHQADTRPADNKEIFETQYIINKMHGQRKLAKKLYKNFNNYIPCSYSVNPKKPDYIETSKQAGLENPHWKWIDENKTQQENEEQLKEKFKQIRSNATKIFSNYIIWKELFENLYQKLRYQTKESRNTFKHSWNKQALSTVLDAKQILSKDYTHESRWTELGQKVLSPSSNWENISSISHSSLNQINFEERKQSQERRSHDPGW